MGIPSNQANDQEFFSARVWFNKGHSSFEQGKFQESVEFYTQSLHFNPNNSDAWNNKGLGLFKLERTEQAIDCFDKSIALNQTNCLAWLNKAESLKKLGKTQEALECYEKSLQIRPNDNSLWVFKGNFYADIAQYGQAIICYDKALQFSPSDAVSWINKGLCFESLNKPQEALLSFQKALDFNPGSELAKNKVAQLSKLTPSTQKAQPKEPVSLIQEKKTKGSKQYNESYTSLDSTLKKMARRQAVLDRIAKIIFALGITSLVFTLVFYIWLREIVFQTISIWQISGVIAAITVLGPLIIAFVAQKLSDYKRGLEIRNKISARAYASTTGKWCMNCNRDVPSATKPGDKCPYCGVEFAFETKTH